MSDKRMVMTDSSNEEHETQPRREVPVPKKKRFKSITEIPFDDKEPTVYVVGSGKEQDEYYVIEKIVNHREARGHVRNGRQLYEYEIKWLNFDKSDNTWKHEDELDHAADTIDEYWESQGTTRWEVEKILAHRKVCREGDKPFFEYQVKWLGFPIETHATWEKEDCFFGAKEQLDEYKRRVGIEVTAPKPILRPAKTISNRPQVVMINPLSRNRPYESVTGIHVPKSMPLKRGLESSYDVMSPRYESNVANSAKKVKFDRPVGY